VSELDDFCAFCADHLTTEEGEPLTIEPFHEQILADVFAGTRETAVLISKKNGKTSLFAALALGLSPLRYQPTARGRVHERAVCCRSRGRVRAHT
jgi:phage terminase large subunit-like protein